MNTVRQRYSRRWFLAGLPRRLGRHGARIAARRGRLAAAVAPTDPLAPKQPHFTPQGQARHLPVHGRGAEPPGAVRQQAALAKYNGKLPPAELIKGYRAAFISPNSKLLGPKFKFARHGKSGQEIGELLPHLATVVDDIAIVRAWRPTRSIMRRARS